MFVPFFSQQLLWIEMHNWCQIKALFISFNMISHTVFFFQNASTGTTWFPDGVGPDVTEQNPYVPTAGAMAKILTVKFFLEFNKN